MVPTDTPTFKHGNNNNDNTVNTKTATKNKDDDTTINIQKSIARLDFSIKISSNKQVVNFKK